MSDVKSTSYDALVNSVVTAKEPVAIAGGKVLLRGITVMELIQVLRKFPQIRGTLLKMLFGTADDGAEGGFAGAVLDAGPEAIATLIATAADEKDNADFARAVMKISDDDLITLLDRTLELTMPSGASDFFGRFGAIAKRLGLVPPPEEEAETAQAA